MAEFSLGALFGVYPSVKIGTIQRRLAWPLRKDDTQNREAFHIFFLFLAAAKLPNTPPTSTTSIPNYNINLANKTTAPPPQPQPQQQSSENSSLHILVSVCDHYKEIFICFQMKSNFLHVFC